MRKNDTCFRLGLYWLIFGLMISLFCFPVSAKESKPVSICPVTKMADNNKCFECHVVKKKGDVSKWVVKETSMFPDMVPPRHTRWAMVGDQIALRYDMSRIDSGSLEKFVDYARSHKEVKRLIIDLFSPGGSVMAGWKIVSLMNELRNEGFIVETRGYGLAASAAFLILTHGKPAIVSPYTELMWHEVQQWKLIFGADVTTPNDSAEKAKILRHIQDGLNQFLADRSGMDKKAIDEKIRFSEWWMNGKEAVALGFVDGYIVE